MIDFQTLKQTVKKVPKPIDELLLKRQKEYLESIEEGIKEAYRNGCTYYSFNIDEKLYDSIRLEEKMKKLGYKVELIWDFNSLYSALMPVRMNICWED